MINGVFTLPDTDTDFTFTDAGTDTDTMGLKPNCIGAGVEVGVGVGQCEHTIIYLSHRLSVEFDLGIQLILHIDSIPFSVNIITARKRSSGR